MIVGRAETGAMTTRGCAKCSDDAPDADTLTARRECGLTFTSGTAKHAVVTVVVAASGADADAEAVCVDECGLVCE